MTETACVFCDSDGGDVIAESGDIRVVLAEEPGYPGFLRVIWKDHVKEMTDLKDEDAARLMRHVLAAERTLREVLSPDKVNLASLGNMVPHLHWHVIPRFADDPTFPAPSFCPPVRTSTRTGPPDMLVALRKAWRAP